MTATKPRVGLFVTCLVDLHRPSVGFAAIRLLERAGCQVEVPRAQTCCGQPAYNSGDRRTARDLAVQIVEAFRGYEYVIAPSGSCAGMLKHHLPHLFDDDPNQRAVADAMASRVFELVSFLTDVLGVRDTGAASFGGLATYHHSFSGVGAPGMKQQARGLVRAGGAAVVEMTEAEICCGFGGTFCVKYPEISVRMVSDKVRAIVATGAETVLAGDLGCLLNISGRLQREGHRTKVRHVAEVLAGMAGQLPPIGEGRQ